MAQKKYLSLTGLEDYDAKVKALLDQKDAETLAGAKSYSDSLGTNYDPVGAAATAEANAIAHANSKDAAIADAKKAGTDAAATAAAAQTAANAAQSSADAAQGDVDQLAAKVGTVPNGSTVMGIINNIQEAAYDDTAIKSLITSNTTKISTLTGTDTGKSVRKIANEEIATQLIPEDAQASLDTLMEIAAWIQSHPDDAAAMNAAISALRDLVGTIPADSEAVTIVGYINEVITALEAEVTRATASESSLDTRLDAVEATLGTGAGSVTEQIESAVAKAKEYTDAQIDATEAKIEKNATDISGLTTRVTAAEGKISTINTAIGTGGAVTLAIADAKKAGTDAQTSVNTLSNTVTEVNKNVSTNATNITSQGNRITDLETIVGDGFAEITTTEINALFS